MLAGPSNRTIPPKGAAYAKRAANSVAEPLESDSDPEFKAGAYVPPPKPKKSRRSSARNVTQDGDEEKRKYSFTESLGAREVRATGNPLAEYFGDDLGLHSASEDEKDGEADESDMDADKEDGDEEDGDNQDPAIPLKTWTAVYSAADAEEKERAFRAAQDADTESDSEFEARISQTLLKKRSPGSDGDRPSKRLKLSPCSGVDPDADADTDEDAPPPTQTQTSKSLFPSQTAGSGTDTEPESESELFPNTFFQPRPDFPLRPGQSPLPLVLGFHPKSKEKARVPASINTYLRDYQRDGVQFFWRQWCERVGGLLGDDMGLGKTIQVIAFLSVIMKKYGDDRDVGRRDRHVSKLQDLPAWREFKKLPPANKRWPTALIVAPTAVVDNWKREFDKWGYFEVGMYSGKPEERKRTLKDFKMGRLDVVITSLNLVQRDIDLLDDLPWSVIIMDEVHRIKNPRSKLTTAFHRFRSDAVRFGLTGTAIQNSYMELWSLLDLCCPDRVGSAKQWKGYVATPLLMGQSAGATDEQRAKHRLVSLALRDKLLPRFFLRRTKDLIANEMPKKTDKVIFCPLTPKQVGVYKRILATEGVQAMLRQDDYCDCGSRKKSGRCCRRVQKGDLFKYLTTLVKISNHLALILPSPKDNEEQVLRNRELSSMAFPQGNAPKYGQVIMQPQWCGKWAVLDMLLRRWRQDRTNKVLIFTKSLKLLEMLDFHLKANDHSFVRLDGQMKSSERMPTIDRFQEDPNIFVFLITTLSGGTGLNLTAANKVVIFDPSWNPAHDLQAMDRAYRIGQARDVTVYRLLGAGSIEELIYARQIYKQQQMHTGYNATAQSRYFRGVQDDKSRQGELFGIKNIFKFQEDELATKMAIEQADINNLEWALSHMGGKDKKAIGSRSQGEDADARALGNFLLDEPLNEIAPEEEEIQKELRSYGIKYSHHNDEILAPNKIEEERTRQAVKNAKRKATEAKAARNHKAIKKEQSTVVAWPPKRKGTGIKTSPTKTTGIAETRHEQGPRLGCTTHTKPGIESQLKSRRRALIELGFIESPDDLPRFAYDFTRKPQDEQFHILARLDEHARPRGGS